MGLSTKSYEIENGRFTVSFRISTIEPGVFHQWIKAGDLGICINQAINLNQLTWERTVYYKGCREAGFASSWSFPAGDGPLLESDTTPIFHEESYTNGFNDGYTEGYELGVEDTTVVDEFISDIDSELLDSYILDFPEWVDSQKQSSSIFSCDSDIRIDHPFPQDRRMTAIWA